MRPGELRSRLDRAPLLLDGAMGTMLIERGLAAGQAPESWLIEQRGLIESVHREYVEAGSDLILACSFGASRPKLRTSGLATRVRDLNHIAVETAHGASRGRALVGGDMGPTGLHLPPLGRSSLEEMAESLHEQAAELAEAGADLLVLETFYDRREALAALVAARETGLGVLVFMTFERRPRGVFTMMGDELVSTLQALADAGADGVGMNCGVSPEVMESMVADAAAAGIERLMAQPNAGAPRLDGNRTSHPGTPGDLARGARGMLDSGVSVLGGCCGTTPGHIRALRAIIDGEGSVACLQSS